LADQAVTSSVVVQPELGTFGNMHLTMQADNSDFIADQAMNRLGMHVEGGSSQAN